MEKLLLAEVKQDDTADPIGLKTYNEGILILKDGLKVALEFEEKMVDVQYNYNVQPYVTLPQGRIQKSESIVTTGCKSKNLAHAEEGAMNSPTNKVAI